MAPWMIPPDDIAGQYNNDANQSNDFNSSGSQLTRGLTGIAKRAPQLTNSIAGQVTRENFIHLCDLHDYVDFLVWKGFRLQYREAE